MYRRAALGARDASHKTPLHLAVAGQGAERLALVQVCVGWWW